MSQFGLPEPNDTVLEERIEWNSISNRIGNGNEAPRRINETGLVGATCS